MLRTARVLPVAVAVAALSISATSFAEQASTWPLAEAIEVTEGGCVTRAELLSAVENWLGRSAIDRRIRIIVEESEPNRPRFVVMRDGRPAAERRFRPTTIACADLRAALALAIALAIDATILQAVLEPLPPPPEPAQPEPPQPPPKPAPKTAPKPTSSAVPAEAPQSAAMTGELAALLLLGVLPVPAWGGSIAAIVPVGPISIRAGGWATAPAELGFDAGDARIAMVAGEITACLDRKLDGLRVRGCAGSAAGVWSAEGSHFDVNRATAVPWIAATAGLGVELPVGDDVALVSRLHGYVPIVRPTLEVSDPSGAAVEREQAPPAGVTVSLGAMVAFP